MRGQQLVEENQRYHRKKRLCWALCLGTLVLICGILLAVYLASQGPTVGEHFITRSTEDTFRFVGQPVPVRIDLVPSALPGASPVPVEGRALDIAIGIDNSLSMTIDDSDETALQRVKNVVAGFLEATDLERHQVAIARLDQDARVLQSLSRNRQVLERVVRELPDGQGTKVGSGLEAMARELSSVRHQPGALTLAIVLTDGRTNAESLRRAAESLDQQGIFVAPIGIGDFVMDDVLSAVASFPSEYAQGVEVEELTSAYRRWLEILERLIAVDVQIEEHFDERHLELVEDSLGTGVERPANDRIRWTLPFLTESPRTLTYGLRASSIGWPFLDRSQGSVTLRPIGAQQTTMPIHRKPKVIVTVLWLWLLIPLLLFLLLLPWLLDAWRRWRAAAGPARIPPELEIPGLPPLPAALPALDPDALTRTTEPTLIVGLGGAGRWVLTFLKKAVLETNCGRIPDTIRFLVIDTRSAEFETHPVVVGGVELDEEELLLLSEDPENPTELVERTQSMVDDPNASSHLRDWWPVQDFRNLPSEQLQISRGTNQRRPIGRMALHLDLEHGPESSRLWSIVAESIEGLKAHGEPTVFLATSATGGTGSGMFSDVAYLARKISHEHGARGVTVNLLLALQNTYAHQAKGLGFTTPNAFAALRELDRLLACRDRRFTMQYSEDEENPANGRLDSPLLDNCYVFDADREYNSLVDELPRCGIYPAMADAIHTFLYATPGGAFDQELKQSKVITELERESSGHGVVSSLGTFVFRLPMYHFLQVFKIRLARELIAETFDVTFDIDGRWHTDPLSEADEEYVVERLQRFLQEPGPAGSPADILQAVAVGQPSWFDAIVEADRADKAPESYVAAHTRNARRHLAGFVMDLLNADPAVEPADHSRGRFAIAVAVLDHFQQQIASFRSVCKNRSAFGFGSSRANTVDRILAAYGETVEGLVERLKTYLDGVVGASDLTLKESLLAELERTEQMVEASREVESEVLVREYFASEELEAALYQDTVDDERRTEALQRFVWYCNESDGTLNLDLRLMSTELEALKPYGESGIECSTTLSGLTERLLHPMWDREIQPYVEQAYPNAIALADKLYERANPFIHIERAAAARHTVKLFTTLGEGEFASEVLDEIYPKFKRRKHVLRTELRDPHCLSTVIVLDSCPLPSLRAYQQAEKAYLSVPESHLPGLHVLGAEHVAVRLEHRLALAKETKRAFHPRFISYLVRPERVRQFAEALIFGLIDTPWVVAPTRLWLVVDGTEIQLSGDTSSSRSLAPWTTALDTFESGKGQQGQEIPYHRCDEILRALRRKVDRQQLEALSGELMQLKATGQLATTDRDLISYVSLVVHDLTQSVR